MDRNSVYYFFACLFTRPLEPNRLKINIPSKLKSDRFEQLLTDLEKTYNHQTLGDIYQSHFDAPWGDLVSPYASVYIGEKEVVFNEVTLEVANFYRSLGLTYKGKGRIPEDHIGAMLLALSLECPAYQKQGINYIVSERLNFIRRILRPSLDGFLQALENHATCDFYPFACRKLIRFMDEDLIFLEAQLKDKASLSRKSQLDQVLSMPLMPLKDLGGIDSVTNEIFQGMTKGDLETKIPTKEDIKVAGINNCGGACSLNASVTDGKVTRIVTNDALSHGRIKACMRGNLYRHSFLSPKRLKYPMKRVGKRGQGMFEKISWEEALDLIYKELLRVKEVYGPDARYVNYGTGNTALFKGGDQAKRLLALDGGYLNYHNSYSTACISGATPYTFGNRFTGHSPDDYHHSKLIVLWGHDPAATMFGSDSIQYLKEAKKTGTKVIVIDPRMNETARMIADQWIPIRPTTDSAFIAAVSKVIYDQGLQDQSFMDRYCIGFDRDHMPEGFDNEETYKAYLYGERDGVVKSLDWASKITGVPEEVIESFAIEFATSKPAALIQGYGPQRNANGEQIVRSCNLLTCLTGNVGIKGGSAGGGNYLQYPLPQVYPQVQNPVKASIPCFLWTDAVTRSSDFNQRDFGLQGADRLNHPIKLIMNIAGNMLVNQHSDINRTQAILEDESLVEFIVTSDLFMTPSALYSDLVLPGASMFETENIKPPWIGGSYLLYLNKCMDPIFESRFEYDWLVELSDMMGLKMAFTNGETCLSDRLKSTYDHYAEEVKKFEPPLDLPDFERFKEAGGILFENPITSIAYEKEIRNPDLYPFKTPSGKIEIFSKALLAKDNPDEIPAIPKHVPAFEGPEDETCRDYPYQLVGWHTKRRTHSTHDLNKRLERTEPQRLWVNTEDAEALGLQTGDRVKVYNARGVVLVPCLVTHRIMKGVVGLSQGRWVFKNDEGMDVNGSINMLTTSRPTPLVKGNPQHSNRVMIEKY